MNVTELIVDNIPYLKASDNIQKAIDRMVEFRVGHLPIVNDGQFLGLISEEDILEISDINTPVGAVTLTLINPYLLNTQHTYDAIRIFCERKFTVIPVVNLEMEYLGLISMTSMVEHMGILTAATHDGGVIVLEINNRDNSLAHIAQIVESENTQILSSNIYAIPDSTKIEVTLKVNKTEITQIVASFLRYDYVVIATYNYSDKNNGSSDRFDSFMNYLSI